MGEAVDQLLAYVSREDCYTVSFSEVRDLQVVAMNERLKERIEEIKLVKFRAEEAGIEEIRERADVVPLLLPHTAYKSYPENFLIQEKWDRLTRWLGTVSTHPTDNVDLDGVDGIDDWIGRLEKAGHFVSCSSGTTGKAAMLNSSAADMEWVPADNIHACTWATGFAPARDRRFFSLAPVADVARNNVIRRKVGEAYGKPGIELYRLPIPPITIGSITQMIALRKAITEGTATPADVAEYENIAQSREKAVEDAIAVTVDALIEARNEKLFLMGMWGALYQLAALVRERGYGKDDFDPENMMYVGGGLKRAQVPDNYREIVYDTFNVRPEHNYQLYSMQELNTIMPRCREGGRYHVPPWLVCLPLNKDADTLLDCDHGEIQARACFFDLSVDARWGGVISGDRIDVDFGQCECGAQTPSIRDSIVRYADLEGDDKISCAGTVDAYVRGVA